MGYFEDVYVKRVNRYGDNIQDRIQNKREHNFLTVLAKSPNKVNVREINKTVEIIDDEKKETIEELFYDGILQTKEYDQDEIVDYLLVPSGIDIRMGNLLWFTDARHNKEGFYDEYGLIHYEHNEREKPWLAYAVDPYTTAGYSRYTVIELEEKMEWYLDGIYHSSPVHAVGGGSGARDKNINLKFRIQFAESGVYLPNKRYSIIMPADESVKKNNKVTIGGETWRITGFDKISVNGVMYITLEEYLTDFQADDNPIAGASEEANWSISTPLGNNFYLPQQTDSEIIFYTYYKDKLTNTEIEVIPLPAEPKWPKYISFELISLEEDGKFYSGKSFTIHPLYGSLTKGKVQIQIKGQPKTKQIFDFLFSMVPNDKIGVVGPDTLFVSQTKTYIISNATVEQINNATLSNDCAEIIDRTENTITILAKEIGDTVLQFTNEDQFPIEIQSIWLGGKKDNVDS